ncbi:putative squalene monooxygenase [Helianthus annuus]|nr:putative squalene monooxygenase [Helianthus annuus]
MRTSVQIIKFIYVLKDPISFSRWRRYNGHVILADSSPILFRPISNTEVRCLVDFPGQKVPSIANRQIANYLKTIVAPQVFNSLITIPNFFLFSVSFPLTDESSLPLVSAFNPLKSLICAFTC